MTSTHEESQKPQPHTTNTTTRVRLDIAYDGTDFHGWAAQGARKPQPNTNQPRTNQLPTNQLRTVQGVLEEKLSLVTRAPIQLTVAGRTDAGVHASGQVAHADIPTTAFTHRSLTTPEDLVRRLSRMLPTDIRLQAATTAPAGFDARFSALRRHYIYRITTNPAGPLPTRARDTASWNRPIQLETMQAAADALLGLHDFAAFCKYREHATTIRTLEAFEWRDVSTNTEPQTYEAHVVADAFCWSMVRSLVGSCLIVGEGKRPQGFTAELLHQDTRSPLVPVAPAHGLTLTGVDYPADELLAKRAETTRAMRENPTE